MGGGGPLTFTDQNLNLPKVWPLLRSGRGSRRAARGSARSPSRLYAYYTAAVLVQQLMKEAPSLVPGLSDRRKLVVRPSMLTGFVGQPGGLDVYSTPSMINDMEYHIRDVVLAHLPDGWDSLGVHVEFEHSAATMLGEEIDVLSTITEVEGKLVKAESIISDRVGELGRGVHHRIVADMTRHQLALSKRAASLAAQPQPAPTNFVRGPPHHGSRKPGSRMDSSLLQYQGQKKSLEDP